MRAEEHETHWIQSEKKNLQLTENLREALEDVQATRGQLSETEGELARLRDQEVFLQQKVSEAKSLFDELSTAHQ